MGTRKGFLRQKHSCGFNFHNKHLYHYLKSFKHEHLLFIYVKLIYTAQTDLIQICRVFSLNINKLSSLSEIMQVFQCFKNCVNMFRGVHILNLNFPLHT